MQTEEPLTFCGGGVGAHCAAALALAAMDRGERAAALREAASMAPAPTMQPSKMRATINRSVAGGQEENKGKKIREHHTDSRSLHTRAKG